MQIITKGKESCVKFWNQSSSQNTTYRLMRYHIREECDGGTLLLNTVTGELVFLDQRETALLETLPRKYLPEFEELIAHRFLVPIGFDDYKSVNQLRMILRRIGIRDSLKSFSILPTTACNARCFYCYEAHYPRHSMTREMADRVVDYIAAHCGEEKKVNLHWFGGEPTLGAERIDQICDRLTERGFDYSSRMISNGYLFSREMARKAKEKWKLQFVQITLDGTEAIYNQTKAYIKAEGSPYRRVMDNIDFLLDEGVRVSVRMNLGFHNAGDLRLLIDELVKRFSGRKGFSAYVHELFEGKGIEPIYFGEDERRSLIELVESLNGLISEKGCGAARGLHFKETLPSLRLFYCMADDPASVMINPLGQVGKCEHEIFTHIVGEISQREKYDVARSEYWLKSTYRVLCQSCALFPSCGRMINCPNEGECLPVQVEINTRSVRINMLSRFNHANQNTIGGTRQ